MPAIFAAPALQRARRLGRLTWLREPLLFGAVGVINSGVDFTCFVALVWFGWQPLTANTVSFTLGAINSYVLNGKLTFARSRVNTSSPVTIARFAAVTGLNLALSYLAIWSLLGCGLRPAYSKALSILVTFVFGFTASKLLVSGGVHK